MQHDTQIDSTVALGAAALLGALVVVAPWPSVLGAVGAWWILRRRLPRWVWIVAVMLCGLGAARATARLRAVSEQQRAAVAALSPPQRCEVLFEVTRSPIVLTPLHRTADAPARRARVDGVVIEGACGVRVAPLPPGLPVRLYAAPEDVTRRTRLRAMVDIGAVRRFDNPGSRHPVVAEALRGVVASGAFLDQEIVRRPSGLRAWIDRARAHVRTRIERTFLPAVVPHARALVLGEYDLERGEQEAFRVSGLAHLLAVSGTHLIVAVLAVGRLLRIVLARIERLARRIDVGRVAAGVCIALSWLYADFAGGGGSAYRAAAMLSVALLARVLGRQPSGQRALGLSLLGAALIEPLAAHDLSFGLSVAATAGIMMWSRNVAPELAGLARVWDGLRVAARATAAAHLACLPLLLGMSSEVPLLGVAANVLAGPVGELAALPLCLAHAVLGWATNVESGVATLGSGALLVVRAVAHGAADGGFVAHLPPPTPWQLVAVALGLLSGWALPARRRQIGCAAVLMLGALEVQAIREGAPQGELRVTALDVGQGDGVLVDMPDGRVVLVDGGGLVGSPIDTGERVVLDVLRHRRRKRVDVVVLSHPHPDHYTGLLTVLARVPVGEMWVSGLAFATHPEGSLVAAIRSASERGMRVRDARELCGVQQTFGAAQVEVLGPCPTFDRSASANDNSLVLRIQLGDRVALLTGDAEAHQEQELLRTRRDALHADLLKVGHHGSRTSSSPAWLAAVAPSVSMISCGVRNRFAHPHRVTLDNLARAKTRVMRTDRGGAAIWQTDGRMQRWRRNRGPWRDL